MRDIHKQNTRGSCTEQLIHMSFKFVFCPTVSLNNSWFMRLLPSKFPPASMEVNITAMGANPTSMEENLLRWELVADSIRAKFTSMEVGFTSMEVVYASMESPSMDAFPAFHGGPLRLRPWQLPSASMRVYHAGYTQAKYARFTHYAAGSWASSTIIITVIRSPTLFSFCRGPM